jgi:hypothetical protein
MRERRKRGLPDVIGSLGRKRAVVHSAGMFRLVSNTLVECYVRYFATDFLGTEEHR